MTVMDILSIGASTIAMVGAVGGAYVKLQKTLTTLTLGDTFASQKLEEHKTEFHEHIKQDREEFGKLNTKMDIILTQGAKK